MEIGIIKKEIVCTSKEESINGLKIFFVRLLNLDLTEKEDYVVAVDSQLGSGIGDIVLVIKGSPSRQVEGIKDLPVDSAISAKVEYVNVENRYKELMR